MRMSDGSSDVCSSDLSAVGGGVMRDVLLNRTPLILRKEIYASAALAAAVVQVGGARMELSMAWVPWAGIVLCFGLRFLAMRSGWNLPRFAPHRNPSVELTPRRASAARAGAGIGSPRTPPPRRLHPTTPSPLPPPLPTPIGP